MDKKKLFAVSDVHGYYDELIRALDEAGFEAGNPDHLLVFCGDLFDRGPKNADVLRFFERLPNKVTVRGNHEDFLEDILYTGRIYMRDITNRTLDTVAEFFGERAIDRENATVDFSGQTRAVDRICELFDEMKDYYETAHYVFVHGWLPCFSEGRTFRIDPNWRTADKKQWRDARNVGWQEAYAVGQRLPDKTVVCGHRSAGLAHNFTEDRYSDDTSVFVSNGIAAIDAYTYVSGKVNVFVVEDELL